MKNYWWIIGLSLGLLNCQGEKEESTTPEANNQQQEQEKDTSYVQFIAKHQIAKITAKGYAYKFGEPTDESKLYEVTYNAQGYTLDSIIYHKNGIMATLHNTYNDKNKLLVSEILDSTGNITQKIERSFDENGNVTTFQLTQGNNVLYSQKMKYDSVDRITKITEFDDKGNPQIITNYTYNEKGKLIINEEADAAGNIIEKTSLIYDQEGNNTAQTIYGSNGKVIEKNFLKDFDKFGNAKLIEKYDRNDSLVVSYSYTYDDKGEEVKSIIYNGIGQIIRQGMATVDQNGDQILYEIYEGGKGLIGKDERKYNTAHQEVELIVYDGKGNQVKRKTTQYNPKGLMSEVINYDKIDEPLFRITFEYKYHDQ